MFYLNSMIFREILALCHIYTIHIYTNNNNIKACKYIRLWIYHAKPDVFVDFTSYWEQERLISLDNEI